MTDRRRRAPAAPKAAGAIPHRHVARHAPQVEAVLRMQRQAGNAAAGVLVQRDWTQEQTDKVKAQMDGPDWNRDGGPWWLLNGHNPEGLVAILRRLGKARTALAAHPADGSRYDKPRLDLAMAAAGAKSGAGQVSGMDAIRNMMAGTITIKECWDVLRGLSPSTRVALYGRMSVPERRSLLRQVGVVPTREQPGLEAELSGLVDGPPLADLLLEFVPDARSIPDAGGTPQPMGELRVLVKGTQEFVVPARGGPPKSAPDTKNPGHTFNPTTPGTFRLGAGSAVVTSSWGGFSQVANGTPARDTGTDVEFERAGKWVSVRTLKVPLTRLKVLDQTTAVLLDRDVGDGTLTPQQARAALETARSTGHFRALPSEWIINDFGKEGFRLEGTKGDIIHTTPATDDRATALDEGDLIFSHGCIHILADDRQKLIERGFLRGGVMIRVHPYKSVAPAPKAP